MTLYYRIDDPSDVRDLGEQIAAWTAAGNPKAAAWAPQPPQPSPESVWSGGQWVTPTPSVPESVTPYQFRMALLRSGVSLAQVDSLIDSLPQPARDEARVAWEYGLEVRRDHPLVGQFAASLGMTAEQVDAAFVEAKKL
jgi:hypothetical protein